MAIYKMSMTMSASALLSSTDPVSVNPRGQNCVQDQRTSGTQKTKTTEQDGDRNENEGAPLRRAVQGLGQGDRPAEDRAPRRRDHQGHHRLHLRL